MDLEDELARIVARFYLKLCKEGIEPWVAVTLAQHYMTIRVQTSPQGERPGLFPWPIAPQGENTDD